MLAEPPKIIQPRNHRARICLWADLTVNDVDIILETTTAEQLKGVLAGIFHLEDHAENLKTAIALDLYYYTVQFARDHGYTAEQLSALFSIVKKTHEVCIETPFDNLPHCFQYFKELILCHAVQRPPHSIDLFSPEDVRKISEYVIKTYFRHYKMYKYVFTPLVRLDLSITYAGMPPTPAPSEVDEKEVNEDQETGEDAEGGNKEETEQPAEGTEGQKEEPEKVESPAASELRAIIKSHLAEEIKNLRVTMDTQIKESEDILNKKLLSAEAGSGGKGGRGSGKGKKK